MRLHVPDSGSNPLRGCSPGRRHRRKLLRRTARHRSAKAPGCRPATLILVEQGREWTGRTKHGVKRELRYSIRRVARRARRLGAYATLVMGHNRLLRAVELDPRSLPMVQRPPDRASLGLPGVVGQKLELRVGLRIARLSKHVRDVLPYRITKGQTVAGAVPLEDQDDPDDLRGALASARSETWNMLARTDRFGIYLHARSFVARRSLRGDDRGRCFPILPPEHRGAMMPSYENVGGVQRSWAAPGDPGTDTATRSGSLQGNCRS
jgi:hypothetical protein